jgi:hypothetical protein
MTTHQLDVAKLARDVDRRRAAGKPGEIPFREIARQIGVGPSMFTRLSKGQRPDVDSLLSLLMWLSPEARISDYSLTGSARTRTPRRRQFAGISTPTS